MRAGDEKVVDVQDYCDCSFTGEGLVENASVLAVGLEAVGDEVFDGEVVP